MKQFGLQTKFGNPVGAIKCNNLSIESDYYLFTGIVSYSLRGKEVLGVKNIRIPKSFFILVEFTQEEK